MTQIKWKVSLRLEKSKEVKMINKELGKRIDKIGNNLDVIDEKLKRCVTFKQTLTLSIAGLSMLLGLIYYTMNSHTKALGAEIARMTITALTDFKEKQALKWEEREAGIIEKVVKHVRNLRQ